MARLAIAGYPNTGKTTLFNALTGLDAPTAPHPYSTTEPNQGVARVPDPSLERLGAIEGSAKVVPATLDLLDLPMTAKGPAFSGELLGRLRDMEALAIVLRAFDDPAVPADDSGTDPVSQAQNLLLELALADAEVLERRAEKAAKEATADAGRKRLAETVAAAAAITGRGDALRTRSWTAEELGYLSDLAPLTAKPAVWVVNVAEGDDADLGPAVAAVVPDGDVVVSLSAQIEAEAAQLDEDERAELFAGLGLGEGALASMVGAAHGALDVIVFYTTGPKETRAWTVLRGATARRAAGRVHSDFERGFIRAEVAPIGDVIDAGGWDAAKAAGIARLEGKEYVMTDGDVMEVRFSV